MKNCFLILLISLGCSDDNLFPICGNADTPLHIAKHWNGRITEIKELNTFAVDYFVPGTIDSRYTSLVCNGLKEAYKIDGLEVVFSGSLTDDYDEIQLTTQTGGQEFFFLYLDEIESKKE